MNTYDRPWSVRLNVDSGNLIFREEKGHNKTRLYIYTAHMLAKPLYLPVRHKLLDLDNGLPGIVLRFGKTNNDDTISFLAHVDTCATMNTGNVLLHKYIMTKHPSLVAEFIQYDDADPFDPLTFQCAVVDLVKTENDHGNLTDIVRY